MEHVDVIRQTSKIEREVWRFWYNRKTLWLDYYALEKRETPRHGWKINAYYSRLNDRWFKKIPIQEVPLTEDIKNEVLSKFMKEIKVKIWQTSEDVTNL